MSSYYFKLEIYNLTCFCQFNKQFHFYVYALHYEPYESKKNGQVRYLTIINFKN